MITEVLPVAIVPNSVVQRVLLGRLRLQTGGTILVSKTRLAPRRLRRRAGPPSYRVILGSGIYCQLSLIAVNHIIQAAPEKLFSFDTPFHSGPEGGQNSKNEKI